MSARKRALNALRYGAKVAAEEGTSVAANPTVVLGLFDRVESAETIMREIAEHIEGASKADEDVLLCWQGALAFAGAAARAWLGVPE